MSNESNVGNVSRDSGVPDDASFEEVRPQLATPAPLISPDQQPCPKCHSQMVEGWMPNFIDGGIPYSHHTWLPGPPAMKKLKTLFPSEAQAIASPDLKNAIPLTAFRCVRCGFVELYARGVG